MNIRSNIRSRNVAWLVAGAVACAALVSGRIAKSNADGPTGGTSAVYGNVPADQVEFLSDKDRIVKVARNGSPIAIWEALEHGERVECHECIPAVAPLLYDASPVSREIAAWWLRRRIFGVFGAGEVYEQVLGTLKNDPNPVRRAQAAEALGEFLAAPGIVACAEAITSDQDPLVRAAAAKALGRLNDDGKGALARAMTDAHVTVRLAAVNSASRINSFADPSALARLTSDADPAVRKRAAEVIGAHRVRDAVGGLIALAQNDPDANVRGAACHSLGLLGDPAAKGALEAASNDSNGLVRDLAKMALRKL